MPDMRPIKDLKNKKFGKLFVIGDYKQGDGKSKLATWLCKCDCGNYKRVASSSLKSGITKSCGCLVPQKTRKPERHGGTRSPTYSTWTGMKSRCDNPNAPYYSHYGGRGITYCKEWESYKNFLADMGERPKGLTLDRINGNGNYEVDNCRWATPAEQSRNLKHTKLDVDTVSVIKTIIMYSPSTPSYQIAKLLGVATSTVGNVRSNHRWQDVTPLAV